jgi:hypothetical protein
MTKPLMIIFLGIDRMPNEFDLNPSITKNMELEYDIIYITIFSSALYDDISIDITMKNIINILEKEDCINRPKVLCLAHSFGCIICLHIIKYLNIDKKTKVLMIFIDPTTQYTKNYLKKINDELIFFIDNVPMDIRCKKLIFTHNLTDHKKQETKINAILKLFDNNGDITIKSVSVESKSKIIPHNLHMIYPKLILDEIKIFDK